MKRVTPIASDVTVVAAPRWAEALARVLDSAYVIPGTGIRVGLDAALGLILPGAGDAATALATAAFIWVGFRQGVPKIILLRMLLNLAIDAAVGAIPIIGDVFDVFHRAAAKNLALLREYSIEGHHPRTGDYVFVGFVLAALGALLVLPLILLAGLVYGIAGWMAR